MNIISGNIHKGNQSSSGTSKLILIFIACIPIIFLFLTIREHKVDIPFGDQWDFVPLLIKSYKKNITISDLAVQHNEHRYFFPRLIWLGMAHLTEWNICIEISLNFCLALIIFILLGFQLKKTGKILEEPNFVWIIPILAMIFFSINQWINWLWGWQIAVYLNLLCVISAILLLSKEKIKWYQLASAIILSLIASFSFANGLLLWLVGVILILIPRSIQPLRKRWPMLAIWIISSIVVFGIYFNNYYRPPQHQPLLSGLSHPLNLLWYFFVYLGNAFADDTFLAGILGVAGFILFVFLAGILIRKKTDHIILTPYFGIAIYILATAGISAISRVRFGPVQALSSRYTTFTNLFWMVMLLMFFIVILSFYKKSIFDRVELMFSLKYLIIFLIFIVYLYILNLIKTRFFHYFFIIMIITIFSWIIIKIIPLFSKITGNIKNPSNFFYGLVLLVLILAYLHVNKSLVSFKNAKVHGDRLKKIRLQLKQNQKTSYPAYLYPPNPDKILKYIKELNNYNLSLFRK